MIQCISVKGHNSYHAIPADLTGNNCQQMVGATYDGVIFAIDETGSLLWQFQADSFCFDLRVVTLDAMGDACILVATASGTLYLLDHGGRLIWTYHAQGPLYQVAVGRVGEGKSQQIFTAGVDHYLYVLEPSGQLIAQHPAPTVDVLGPYEQADKMFAVPGVIRLMDCADVTGNGCDDLVFTCHPRQHHCDLFVYTGESLSLAWRKRVQPQGKTRWPVHAMALADLNEDGATEIVLASGLAARYGVGLIVLNHEGESLCEWENDDAPNSGNRNDYIYRMPQIAVDRLPGISTPGVYMVMGPEVILFDAKCRVVDRAVAPLSFTNFAMRKTDGTPSAILASSPNGDDTLYRIDFDNHWTDELASLTRQGLVKKIGDSIHRLTQILSQRIERQNVKATESQRERDPYIVEIAACKITKEHVHWQAAYLDHFDWLRAQLPYDNLHLTTVYWVSDEHGRQRPDGGEWERDGRADYQLGIDELVVFAQRQEDRGAPFLLQTAHGNGRFLSLEASEAMLQAAPTTLMGFVCAESRPMAKLSYAYYVNNHLKPLAELCLRYGNKKIVMREKGAFWSMMPATGTLANLLKGGEYRDVLVPCIEDSNSTCPELNLAGRVGLWLTGVVNTWGARVIGDNYCSNRLFEWEAVMHGHPSLRTMVAHASLGAKLFMFHHGGDNLHGEGTWQMTDSFHWHDVGRESELPFLHLLGQRLLTPPKRDELAHLADVCLVVCEPSERFRSCGMNAHGLDGFGRFSETEPYVFSHLDCYWAYSPTPGHSASAYLYGNDRQFGNYIPPTVNGFVPIVPNWIDDDSLKYFKDRWITDGDTFFVGNQTLEASEGSQAILGTLNTHKATLPFGVSGDPIFFQVAAFGDRYQLVLVDPALVHPVDLQVVIVLQDASIHCVRDGLTGESLPVENRCIHLTVEAGMFRILTALRE